MLGEEEEICWGPLEFFELITTGDPSSLSTNKKFFCVACVNRVGWMKYAPVELGFCCSFYIYVSLKSPCFVGGRFFIAPH